MHAETPSDASPLMTRKTLAAVLKRQGYPIALATLASMASRGGGPQYRRFGGRCLYHRDDVAEWVEGRLSAPRGAATATRRKLVRAGTNRGTPV